jgi:hypothetical protein
MRSEKHSQSQLIRYIAHFLVAQQASDHASACRCSEIHISFLELKGFDLGAYEIDSGILCALIGRVLLVHSVLPSEPSENVYARSVATLCVASNSSTQSRLKINLLHRTLQKRRAARVKPVVPMQKPQII